jgi:hypothetical protein
MEDGSHYLDDEDGYSRKILDENVPPLRNNFGEFIPPLRELDTDSEELSNSPREDTGKGFY